MEVPLTRAALDLSARCCWPGEPCRRGSSAGYHSAGWSPAAVNVLLAAEDGLQQHSVGCIRQLLSVLDQNTELTVLQLLLLAQLFLFGS